jgi:antitoxin ParD1/3/4
MDVHLTDELALLVQARVNSGQYRSASEVVGDALRLLAHRDSVDGKIAEALDSCDRGDEVDGHEFFAQLEREELALAANAK